MKQDSDQRLRNLRELPQDIAPERDLWPGIAAALTPGAQQPTRAQPRQAAGARVSARPPLFPRYVYGLAASVALLAMGVWLGRTVLPGVDANGIASARLSAAATPAAAPAVTMAAAFALDPASKAERQRRLVALAGQLQALPPETQLKVKASLAAIEKSVTDIQSALGRDPGNLLLQEMLVNSYQDEMRVFGAVDEANRFAVEPGI
jgi:hypothetical protein